MTDWDTLYKNIENFGSHCWQPFFKIPKKFQCFIAKKAQISICILRLLRSIYSIIFLLVKIELKNRDSCFSRYRIAAFGTGTGTLAC